MWRGSLRRLAMNNTGASKTLNEQLVDEQLHEDEGDSVAESFPTDIDGLEVPKEFFEGLVEVEMNAV